MSDDAQHDADDDERRRIRRKNDAAAARRRRACARAEREKAYDDAKTTRSNVVALRTPAGSLLLEHLNIASILVRAVVGDSTISKIDRANCAIRILGPMARGVEVGEFRDKLLELEARQTETERARGLRSVP